MRWLNEQGRHPEELAAFYFEVGYEFYLQELQDEARAGSCTVYELLNERLDALSASAGFPARLTRELHVLPYFLGNRSPRADPTLRGAVSGLRLSDTVDDLALLYLATIQAVAHGTRHIIDTMNAAGCRIDTILADRKSTRLNSSHSQQSRMPSSA